ncbi:hypothetical protein [Asticcacaulis sp. W401b]|uniref:hypothetical protein n=1 Tax=Asticcacaulis sp. W401b TaxID=3388666 RepID=UPI003970CFAA
MGLWTRRAALGSTAATVMAAPLTIAATAFTPSASVKALMSAHQSAICQLAEFGGTQVLLLLINGTPVEAHARRRGLYQRKLSRLTQSGKAIAPVNFNRLITAAGGIDRPVGGTARAPEFNALYAALPPVPQAPDPCPADFDQRSAAERSVIRQALRAPDNSRYLPCFVEDAQTVRLPFSDDPFFTAWAFERDAQGHFLALTLPGVRAIWALEA